MRHVGTGSALLRTLSIAMAFAAVSLAWSALAENAGSPLAIACDERIGELTRAIASASRVATIVLVWGAAMAAVGSVLAGFLTDERWRRAGGIVGVAGALLAVLPRLMSHQPALEATLQAADGHRATAWKVQSEIPLLQDETAVRQSESYVAARFAECRSPSPHREVPALRLVAAAEPARAPEPMPVAPSVPVAGPTPVAEPIAVAPPSPPAAADQPVAAAEPAPPAGTDPAVVAAAAAAAPAEADMVPAQVTKPASRKEAAGSFQAAPEKAGGAAASVPPARSAPAATAPSGPAIDREAAVAALSSAARSAAACKKPDGPTGTGRVAVTFAPTGKATATIEGAPFAGTPVGGCVAAWFRAVHVAPFGGDPVTVRKTFVVE